MNRNGRLHALLATARVANIPSVTVNIWCGAALAFVIGDVAFLPLRALILVTLAGTLLYVGGNLLNDWMDRDWDARNRPERALPSGTFRPATYLMAGAASGVIAISLAAAVSSACALVAGLIACFVILYTWIHKKTVWSVVPMGLCRGLLPLMGAASVAGVFSASAIWPGIALFAYIAGLSLTARFESSGTVPPAIRRIARGLFFVPPALGIWIHLDLGGLLLLAGLVPYGLWMMTCDLMRRMKVFRFVSFLLAGIPLVDGIFLIPIGLSSPISGLPITCIALPLLAFVSALLLQRLAPAT